MTKPSRSKALSSVSNLITILGILATVLATIFSFFTAKFRTDTISVITVVTLLIVLTLLIVAFFVFRKFRLNSTAADDLAAVKQEKNLLEDQILQLNKQKKELEKGLEDLNVKNLVLTDHISKGLKITYNKVKVEIDEQESRYIFTFKKRFTVISKKPPKKFTTQFYSNITRDDQVNSHRSRSPVEKEPCWDDLNCYANLVYRDNETGRMSDSIDLIVKPVHETGHYIPFDIIFSQVIGNKISALEFACGTEFSLEYGYNVPMKFWGTYLNRTLSCFGEEATFKLEIKGQNSRSNINLYEQKDRLVRLLSKPPTRGPNGKHIYELDLPREPFGKYVIYWDELNLKGAERSPVKIDDTSITDF